MEMVAASKMRKAQDRMLGKPYAQRIRNVVGHIAKCQPEYQARLFEREEVKRVGYIVVVSTDRGLCGGLNINLFKKVVQSHAAVGGRGCRYRFVPSRYKSRSLLPQCWRQCELLPSRDLGDEPELIRFDRSVKVYARCIDEGEIDRLILGVAMSSLTP